MGFGLPAAIGAAAARPDALVVDIDGDGSLLMNLGTLVTIGAVAPKNFVHFVGRMSGPRGVELSFGYNQNFCYNDNAAQLAKCGTASRAATAGRIHKRIFRSWQRRHARQRDFRAATPRDARICATR